MKKCVKVYKHILLFVLLGISSIVFSTSTFLFIPDTTTYSWLNGSSVNINYSLIDKFNSIPELVLDSNACLVTLPDSVDNSQNIYMRPIIVQSGESCGQAAGIAYTYTYEINYLRNLPANHYGYMDNQYPTHYTWNYLNNGTGGGSWYFDGWDIIKQNGCPNISSWGGLGGSPVKWMTGYENYSYAMKNSIDSYFHIDVADTNGLKTLKHWLLNHNDINQNYGGLACFSMFTGGITEYDTLTSNSVNSGKSIIADWIYSTSDLHSLTIVGFNDSIKYDINNDGVFSNSIDLNGDSTVDMQDWEIGALKIADSHGAGHPRPIDMGYFYLPYRLLAKQVPMPTNPDSIVFPFFYKHAHVLKAKEEYMPEITVKLKISHYCRGFLTFLVGYGENASQTNYIECDTVLSYHENGGIHPIHGIDFDPIELVINYGHFFKDEDFGKVFFEIADRNFATSDTSIRYIHEYSVVDYRWGDTLEVMSNLIDLPIAYRDTTTISINYDLIPHHEDKIDSNLLLYSDMVSRFEPTVTNNATLTVSDISIDMYESTIKIEDGSSLIIKDNAVIHAKKGDCKIIIDGDADFGENITFKADSAASLLIVINKEDLTFTINNCEFINSAVNSFSKAPVITNCDFQNSSIYCKNNYGSNDTAIISYNKFADAVDSTAIAIEKFNAFTIENNEIDNCLQGISLSDCGRSSSTNQNIINNKISDCNGVGINTSNSFSNILKNLIEKCDIGIKLHNKSTTCLAGDTNTLYIENMNRVYNCDSYEVYFSKNSYPWYFHYNVISDYDNGGNSVGDPMLYYDPENTEMSTIQDAEYNCWGDNFSPSADLYPDTLIDHLPMYCPPASPEETKAVETQYQTNLDLMAEEEYTQSKSGFMSIIEQNPGTKYAQSAMRELIDLEKYAGNDYTALKIYFQTNTTIQSDSILAPLASKLANDCDIELQNYTAAINYFEGVIQNPADIQDSIFAIINLGDLYENISTGNKASLVGKMPQYKPRSAKQFNKYKYDLLSLLPVKKESATGMNNYYSEKECDFKIHPNPAKEITSFEYALKRKGYVQIKIYATDGTQTQALHEGTQSKGTHKVTLNTSAMKPGLYYCSLVADGVVLETRKMMVIH
jgi:hypothetical protein